MNKLNKTLLREQLKKSGNAPFPGEQELGFFRRTFELARDNDYDGILSLSHSHPEIFRAFSSMLEQRALKILQKEEPAGSYLYFLLRKLFSRTEEGEYDNSFTGGATLQDKKILELFLLLHRHPFGLKENRAVRLRITEWNLSRLRDWVWQKGLTQWLNDLYRAQTKTPTEDLPVGEILANINLPKLLKENELTDNYVFDRLGHSKTLTGNKADQYLEKKFRLEAAALRDRLYEAINAPELNFVYIRKALEDLHMQREIELIERLGVNLFKAHLDSRWSEGAAQVARLHDFIFTPPGGNDPYTAISRVNHSFMKQARQSVKGKYFLRREAVLCSHQHCAEAACYLLPGNFVVVCLLQEEGLEHILFGQFPAQAEREKFIGRCMSDFFHFENPRQKANKIIDSHLERMTGALRLRKAIRNALIALPVMAVVAVMLTWVYNFTMKNLGDGAILGLALGLLGIGIAARNGFIQKIQPQDYATIPEHLVLQRGVTKIVSLDEVALAAEID